MLPNDLNSETSYLKFKDSIKQWLEPKFIYFFFINFNHTTIHQLHYKYLQNLQDI